MRTEQRYYLSLALACAFSLVISSVPAFAAGGIIKTAIIAFEGPATDAGSFELRLVPRGDDNCMDAAIHSHTTGYDEAAGGVLPTTAIEIRDSTFNLMNLPAGYTKQKNTFAGFPVIVIEADKTNGQHFDICIGAGGPPLVYTKVIGLGIAGQWDSLNGLKITGVSKDKPVPAVSEWGMIVMILLALTAGTVVFARWRRPAAA